jgi:predicted RecA/RadA family phage recombinase
MSGFQSAVNLQQAPAIAGDFASANPRASRLAGEGALVVGSAGCTIGRFAWVSGTQVTNAGSGVPSGFVHREMQAVITTYLAEGSNVIPAGRQITLMVAGDFWAKTLTTATVGQKVFASLTTGEVKTDAAGATVAGYIETAWKVASAAAANELIKMTTWGV